MKQYHIKYSVFSLLFLFLAGISQAQDREILFIHGLGGTADSWNVYEQHFPSIPPISNLVIFDNEYDSDNDIATSAAESRADFQRETIQVPETAIAFGHSMGGVVARQLDFEFKTAGQDMLFGGLVTSGAPNQGAAIFNSIQNGDMQVYFGEGCKEVITDPIGSTLNLIMGGAASLSSASWVQKLNTLGNSLNSIGGMYSKLPIPNGSNSILCDGLWFGMNFFNVGPAKFNTASGVDLAIGSPTMNTLNTFQANQNGTMPMVTVWGNEQRPIHWREWESILFTKPATLPLNQTDDENLMNIMDGIENGYQIASTVALIGSVACAIGGIWYPPVWVFVMPAAICFIEFYQGAYWIKNDSEVKWAALIGATSTATVNVTMQNFSCIGQLITNGLPWLISLSWSDIKGCFQTNTIAVAVPIILPSDGIIAEDQAKIPGVCDIRVDRANHQELRNHPNATKAYSDIFNVQQQCIHPFFLTN